MCDLSQIDVVVLAGGLGKRLRSATGDSPKVLAEVNGVPFMDILLESLSKQGFKRVILCIGYKSEIIEQHYKEKFLDLEIEFSKEEMPLGTGGAIKNAKEKVRSQFFFALNGDCFCSVSFRDFLDFYKKKQAFAAMVLTETDDKKDFGSVVVSEDKKIISFQEKSNHAASPYVSVGIYCFNSKIFDLMPTQDTFSIENDFFPHLVNNGFYGYVTKKGFLDIGTPERYNIAQKKINTK